MNPVNGLTGLTNGKLGMMLVVGTETLVFSSFIGTYIVLRSAAVQWPPLGVPSLRLDLSVVNTLLLLVSAVTAFRKKVAATFILGVVFLLFQAVEFHRLYAQGLTLKTGTYGALFYTLISCHALHVIGGLGILAAAYIKTSTPFPRGGEGPDEGNPSPSPSPPKREGVEWLGYAETYWYFVTAVWLVLFSILYLA